MSQLEQLRKAAQKATPAPWSRACFGPDPETIYDPEDYEVAYMDPGKHEEENGAFIAVADPTTIIAMCDALLLADAAIGDWMCGNCENVDSMDRESPISDVLPEQMDARTCEHCRPAVEAHHAIAKVKGES